MPKTLLITGCASGIGYTMASHLQKYGYQVLATDWQAQAVDRLNKAGFDAFQLDVNDPGSINTALQAILARTDGRLDVLINNAGYGIRAAVEDLPRDVMQAVFNTNLFGLMDLSNRVIPIMRQQGHGRIINMSSLFGLVAAPFRGAYVATKFALEGLTDTLRLELHGSGICVTLIEPGPVATPFGNTAAELLRKYIDINNSKYQKSYQKMLSGASADSIFTLPPEAVVKKVLHALESVKPKARYYVTFPTYLLSFLRHILPTTTLDWLIRRMYQV